MKTPESLSHEIRKQYALPGLGLRIERAFEAAGLNLSEYQDLHGVDQLHIRGVEAIRELAGQTGLPPGSRVLDVGCGLGGTARLVAAEWNWRVVGVDLCRDFVLAAQHLTHRVGMARAVDFLVADGTVLPFIGGWADAVFSVHVQMNIPAKRAFLSQAAARLKPGGLLVVYEIFAGPSQPVHYPTPWADHAQRSFLCTPEQFVQMAKKVGFHCRSWQDQSVRCLRWLQQRGAQQSPATGPDIKLVMAGSPEIKLRQVQLNLEENRIRVFSGIFSR